MATLVSRIVDLAAATRDKFNQIMPRLLPPGGTTGQALVKASNADNSFQWLSIAGSGTSSRFRGAFGSTYTNKTATFSSIPSDWSFSNPPSIVSDPDSASNTTSALSLATTPESNGVQSATFTCKADATFNQLIVRYRVESEADYDFFRIFVDDVEQYRDSGLNAYKTATVALAAGSHSVRLQYNTDAGTVAGFNNVHFSKVTMPQDAATAEPYAYGDSVSYNGGYWFCIKAGTSSVPGSNSDWQSFNVPSATGGTGGGTSGTLPANRGPWQSSNVYSYADAVTYNGATWFAVKAGTTQTPSSASSDWKPLGSAGQSIFYATGFPANSSASSSAYATKGRTINPSYTIKLRKIIFVFNSVAGASYTGRVLTLSGQTIMDIKSTQPFTASAAVTAQTVSFDMDAVLYTGNVYGIVLSRTDGSDTYTLPIYGSSTAATWSWMGVDSPSEARQLAIARGTPQVGQTLISTTPSAPFSGEISYTLGDGS